MMIILLSATPFFTPHDDIATPYYCCLLLFHYFPPLLRRHCSMPRHYADAFSDYYAGAAAMPRPPHGLQRYFSRGSVTPHDAAITATPHMAFFRWMMTLLITPSCRHYHHQGRCHMAATTIIFARRARWLFTYFPPVSQHIVPLPRCLWCEPKMPPLAAAMLLAVCHWWWGWRFIFKELMRRCFFLLICYAIIHADTITPCHAYAADMPLFHMAIAGWPGAIFAIAAPMPLGWGLQLRRLLLIPCRRHWCLFTLFWYSRAMPFITADIAAEAALLRHYAAVRCCR